MLEEKLVMHFLLVQN